MDDTLDSLFDDDEEAEDAVMSQILDEIGIEVSDKVCAIWFCLYKLHRHNQCIRYQQESGDQDNMPIQPVCKIPVYAQQESGDQDNVPCKNPSFLKWG